MHLCIHGLPPPQSLHGGTGVSVEEQVEIAKILRQKPLTRPPKSPSQLKYFLIQRAAVRIMTLSPIPHCYTLDENHFLQTIDDDTFWNRLVWSKEDLAAFHRISHICFRESPAEEQLVINLEDPFLKLNDIRKDNALKGLSISKIFEWRFELCRMAIQTDTSVSQIRKVRNRLMYLLGIQYCLGSQIMSSLKQRGSKKLHSQERLAKRREWERCRQILKWDENLLLCWQIELQRWETRRTHLENAIEELSKLCNSEKLVKYSSKFVVGSTRYPKLLDLCTFTGVLEPKFIRLIHGPPTRSIFDILPPEVRVLIWKYAAPGPRIIFQHPGNNKSLPLLRVCRESRAIAKSQYTPVHLPSPKLGHSPSKYFAILYVDLNNDTVVRDLSEHMNPGPGTAVLTSELHPLFHETGSVFSSSCVRHFWGLARIRRLTIPFNMERDIQRVFVPLLYCCPKLEVLNFVPTSQLRPQKGLLPLTGDCGGVKLIPINRELLDYVDYRLAQLPDKKIRREKASRAANQLARLYSASVLLRNVELPKVIRERRCGGHWTPEVRVCIVATWRACPRAGVRSSGWYSRNLLGDYYTQGYMGDDGKRHNGFLECLNLMGEDCVFRNQYEGVAAMFEQFED